MDICDFHAHILPNADHGSSSLSVSLRQLSLANKCGVSRIVATPHFYPHRENVEEFVKRRNRAYKVLMDGYADGKVSVRLGAEVLICDNIESIPMLDSLCLYGSKVLLLELPTHDFSKNYCYSVSELMEKGIQVVIAHADRYDKENVNKLISRGAKIQLNSDSLSGMFSHRHLFDWLESGHVVAIGSDIHGEDKRAYKSFLKAKNNINRFLPYIKKESDDIWDNLKTL